MAKVFNGANPKWTLGKIQSDIFAEYAEKQPTSDGNADGNETTEGKRTSYFKLNPNGYKWGLYHTDCIRKGIKGGDYMRLIDADAFINNVVKYSHQSTKTIGKALDDTPTVDAVPVVRCKECRHFKTMNLFGNVEFCDRTGEEIERWLMVGAEDFCSKGERKSK